MKKNFEIKKSDKKENALRWRRYFWIILVVIAVSIAAPAGIAGYAERYKGRVWPGVHIGDVPIGGMNKEELKLFLQKINDRLVNEGLKFKYESAGRKKELIIYPLIVSEGESFELVGFDIDASVDWLFSQQKNGNIIERGFRGILARIYEPHFSLPYARVDGGRLLKALQENLYTSESLPQNARLIVLSVDPLTYEIASSSPGAVYLYNEAPKKVLQSWSNLKNPEISITKEEQEAEIKEADLEEIKDTLPKIFDDGGIGLTHIDPHTRLEYGWQITSNEIKDWIEAQKTDNGKLAFGLSKPSVLVYLQKEVAPTVNIEARNAKFRMDENGKVMEFQGSRPGIQLDLGRTYEMVNEAILERNWHEEGLTKSVSAVFRKTEPVTKTEDVNNFGIAEILGIGISSYAGSPTNRIKNIRNAVNKLNGVLIKPGEEFSALKHTAPFSAEGGYLPELVIKGDEIKPEVGGGLCQIGTTLFRMAMNSGMKITQRRNHSLVVNYYNDPVNRLPGTDATVYDPAPDFRFLNDTGNYLLIQTQMDAKKQEILFTLWGTSDGRKGYYSRPKVSKWYSAGEKKTIETTKLKPGEEKCQHAYKGADASFTYTRELPDGTKEEIVYESHYRPLPEICLIGVEEAKCEEEECPAGVAAQPDVEEAPPATEG